MKFPLTIILIQMAILASVVATGCDAPSVPVANEAPESPDRLPVVVVSSYPLYALTSYLAAEAVNVKFLIPPNAAPVTWKPGAADIRQLQTADAVLLSGAGYEHWRTQVSLPRSRTYDTSTLYHDRILRVGQSATHQHGPEGAAADGDVVWATWLDPELAVLQLQQVQKRLSLLVPTEASAISQRAAVIAEQLERLDQRIEQLAAEMSENDPVVFTDGPYYEYLARRLGWTCRPLSGTANAEPPADVPPSAPPRLFLHRRTAAADALQTAADRGLQPVVIDLCEQPLSTLSFPERIKQNIARLEQSVADR